MDFKAVVVKVVCSVYLFLFACSAWSESEEAPPAPLNLNASISSYKNVKVIDRYFKNDELARELNAEEGSGLSQYNLGDGQADSIQLGVLNGYIEYSHFKPDVELMHTRYSRMSSYSVGVSPVMRSESLLENLGLESVSLYFMPKLGAGFNHYYSNESESYSVVEMLSAGGELGVLIFDAVRLGLSAQAQCVNCFYKDEEDENDWTIIGEKPGAVVQYGYGMSLGVLF